jgi:GalNAc-alpha-(1->4)-GalNAc-alpha-(1->3)-diNAcBac-PP-undecaprenol alpha-1,4-N-acetyl-D-galactosaminyltransferase
MRLTCIISGLGGGGAERVCVNLANAWAGRGHRVTILTVARGTAGSVYALDPRVGRAVVGWPRAASAEELNADSVAAIVRGLHHAGCPELMNQFPFLAALRCAILATEPEVAVAFIDMTNVHVLAATQETGVPVVACEQTDPDLVSFGWQNARTALYRRAHAVVAPHPSIAEWFGRRGARARAIPNPLVAPPTHARASDGERHRIVTLARLSPEKRVDLLIRAFALVADEFPKWDVEVYGDGPLRASLTDLAGRLAPGRVLLRGFTYDPYSALHGADLFVSSSWVEGFGNAIWEALACGVPVVATDGGPAVRTLVRDGVDGQIVGAAGAQALASALAALMGDDAARNALAARAPEVLARFPIESALQAWDALLGEVVAQSSFIRR